MRDHLYLSIGSRSFRFAHFLFFDTKSYLADHLFIRHQVRVWFGDEFGQEGSPYVGIFCRVKKKDVNRFQLAMEDLRKSMLITGHTDYETSISELLDKMEKMKGEKNSHEAENDSVIKAKQSSPA